MRVLLRVCWSGRPRGGDSSLVGRVVAGDGEEHLVERRLLHAHLGEVDAAARAALMSRSATRSASRIGAVIRDASGETCARHAEHLLDRAQCVVGVGRIGQPQLQGRSRPTP